MLQHKCMPRYSDVIVWLSLQNLTTLILRENKLKELPPEIGELTSLTVLDASHNSLHTLPRGEWGWGQGMLGGDGDGGLECESV